MAASHVKTQFEMKEYENLLISLTYDNFPVMAGLKVSIGLPAFLKL